MSCDWKGVQEEVWAQRKGWGSETRSAGGGGQGGGGRPVGPWDGRGQPAGESWVSLSKGWRVSHPLPTSAPSSGCSHKQGSPTNPPPPRSVAPGEGALPPAPSATLQEWPQLGPAQDSGPPQPLVHEEGSVKSILFTEENGKTSPHLNWNQLIFSSKWGVIRFRPLSHFQATLFIVIFIPRIPWHFSGSH